MSVQEVERDIPLASFDLLNHSSILDKEVQRFKDNFERNERYKEFDGLLRRQHRIYEANTLLPNLKLSNLNVLLESTQRLDENLQKMAKGSFTKNDLEKVALRDLSQMDIVRLTEAKLKSASKLSTVDEDTAA